MNEELLQFIWKYRLYSQENLQTNTRESIQVIHTGEWNRNAGPDFIQAKIKIGNTLWVGNIELHIHASDWYKHQHEKNASYNNIILHVVYHHDKDIKDINNNTIPTLELNQRINPTLITHYTQLMMHEGFIACEKNWNQVDTLFVEQQLSKVIIERFQHKTQAIETYLTNSKNNWQETFYYAIAKSFGLHINQSAFEQLVKKTPLSLFAKHKQQLFSIEAILFGQAGFLNDYFEENYPLQLQKEYAYYKKLYSLQNISKEQWKFLRLRPANFPTIRIAQFAQLLHQSNHLSTKVMEAENLPEIYTLFDITVSEYWQHHYTFHEKTENKKAAKLGKTFIDLIVINSIIPFLFLYGKKQAKPEYIDKALYLLKQIKPEKNHIIEKWKTLIPDIKNASDTQALLHQYNTYCQPKQCLQCSIGYRLLRV
jgi:hypothetical protein